MNVLIRRRHAAAAIAGGLAAWRLPGRAAEGAPLPLFDAHLHYSHDAWELVPPAQAVALLRQAGLRGALVSSSNDEGTQRLVQLAPELVVAELRPYRQRSDIGSWVRDTTVPGYLEQRLSRYRYAGIGEFHVYGEDADLPVPRAMVSLARQGGLMLHAHSDVDAVGRLFRQWPQARILWAHAGFERPEAVREMLRRHPLLWCDLAYRNDQASDDQVAAGWREAFNEFPERFMVGTDTFTPERWHYIVPHAAYSRGWLGSLPPPLAEQIAWRNAESLLLPYRQGRSA